MWVDYKQKNEALYDCLFANPPGRTMVFVNSKPVADKVDDFLYNSNLPSTSLHSDRTQNERENALTGFREGKTPILVTTGVAARGIDVKNVMYVINYDLPSTMHGGIDEYVHRIGRTGRLGHMGMATSFFNERNDDIAPELVKLLMETEQEIPDFLEDFKPTEGEEAFEDGNSDIDEDEAAANGNGVADAGDAGGETWGAPAAPAGGDDGFAADGADGAATDDAW